MRIMLMSLLLLAAASAHAQAPDDAEGTARLQTFLAQCRDKYNKNDARIDASGRRDAGYYRVPGFPYLRSDRLMVSFESLIGDREAFEDWTLQLRDNDAWSREVEFTNMGLRRDERAQLLVDLRLCAVWLTNTELADEATLKRLVQAMRVPGEPPLPQAERARAAWRAHVQEEFSAPLAAPEHAVLWQARPPADPREVPMGFSGALHDHLGRAGLLVGEWPVLAARYAPQFLIDAHGDYDTPGTAAWRRKAPGVDAAKPAVYYLPAYARVGQRVLVQLNYFAWFSGRGAGDAHMDGLIWRVTLDEDGQPMMYDTIHASGYDQLWFPRRRAAARTDAADPALAPQAAIPESELVVRLRSGTHDVLRLLPPGQSASAQTRAYELRPYEDLLTLDLPGGKTRSLFDPKGNVPGSAGLRQWGRHPVTPLAQHYFDDPGLMGELFDIGGAPAAGAPAGP